MDKGKKAIMTVTNSLENLDLNSNSNPSRKITTNFQSSRLLEKKKTPTLVSLCLGVVGKHLEDVIEDLDEIAINFPADIKMAMAAIARRRRLLNDDVIISLADTSWEILDISGSDVSDFGLEKVVEMCKSLRAVDIRGSPRSDYTTRRCLSIFKPKLNDVNGDSWEELDTMEISNGAESLRWLVWEKIDRDSLEILSTECPRITVNPKSSPFGIRGAAVPREALQGITLDDHVVKDIDPKTWAVCGFNLKTVSTSLSSPTELSVAEKFRLAFVERDTRLAPKRAKNARQHQRRAERELMMTSTRAKAVALASQASKSLKSWN
ncbi:hypothetical protein SO802_014595 [Lithocarpus litseifolius]|uniref:RNI-like superfamily protein n=1 Tax=Lithocarpus litseifolius TaxID=425828 RepID=A0AAW2CSM0_9ROSI